MRVIRHHRVFKDTGVPHMRCSQLTNAFQRGSIDVSFYSADDLERVLDIVLGSTRERL